MNKEPLVSVMEIERFAIHDGPGIRTVLFLQGCPLHCSWCANPESQHIGSHLLYMEKRCIQCGACQYTCQEGNITFKNRTPVFNRSNCLSCGSCAEKCTQNAIRFSGKTLSVPEIMETILRDKIYYLESNGGITFSGGDPFTQYDGLMALLKACKKEQLHTAVETCGQVAHEKIKQAYLYIDLFLFDIKHTEPYLLKKETGASWDLIKKTYPF